MLRQSLDTGGEGGIRTPDTVARMPHFECGAFNHSATSPGRAFDLSSRSFAGPESRSRAGRVAIAAIAGRFKADRVGLRPILVGCRLRNPRRSRPSPSRHTGQDQGPCGHRAPPGARQSRPGDAAPRLPRARAERPVKEGPSVALVRSCRSWRPGAGTDLERAATYIPCSCAAPSPTDERGRRRACPQGSCR